MLGFGITVISPLGEALIMFFMHHSLIFCSLQLDPLIRIIKMWPNGFVLKMAKKNES